MRSHSPASEELDSPYVDGDARVAAWAHDALALMLPAAILCRPGLRRAVRGLRRRPERRGPRAPPRAGTRRPLGEASESGSTLTLLPSRAWPFPSRSSPIRAQPSAAQPTRSAPRPQTRAPSATARACRTACARSAVATRGAVVADRLAAQLRRRSPMVTVAVDGNGADLGPAEVARGASPAAQRRARAAVRSRADSSVADGVELIDAPVSIAKAPDPAYAVDTPEASIVQAARAVATAVHRRSSRADRPARRSPRASSTSSATAASTVRRWHFRSRARARPVLLLDVGANVTCRPEHLVQFAHMGSAFAQAVLGISPRAWRCCRMARSRPREPRNSRRFTSASAATAAPACASSATSRAPT